jgi:hypothetical protein
MKKKVFYLLVLLGAVLVGDLRKAQAQIAVSADGNIPFQFYVGGKELPAGKYTIRCVNSADDSAMEIQSANGKVAALFETERSYIGDATKDNELVFNQVGDNYVLSQIVDGDRGTDAEVFNPGYKGKQDAAQHHTGRTHMFGFLLVL